ncbi:16S rRNA (guanine(527)-N(7))-methyltransferase RsmG [Caldibacillus debilis]|uniref:16S rRNA (guanine(527)-N(7))-methyltransferase RsmG n=1 Tax=Caldibacillus debilis TaxID=301148 RepID=UPI002FDAF3D5
MNTEQFIEALNEHHISLTARQLEQFETYWALLSEWNEKMNLTSINGKEQVYLKHFYDSLTASFFVDLKRSPLQICDVGSGAGFPGIPWKIVFPQLRLTIIDSLKKRILFLTELVNRLQLEGVTLFHERAENAGQNGDFREKFDVVTARAVARLSVLSEFCLPLAKPGGVFLAMKGPGVKEEIKEGKRAISILGGKIASVHTLALPYENSERNIILIEKVKNTPKKYPRKPGIPVKSPL